MSTTHHHHIVQPNTYRLVLALLALFMALTCIAAKVEALNFGITANLIIALAIAGTKMTLIMLFFMHVYYSSKLVRIYAICGLVWLLIMFCLTFMDYVTRWTWHSPFVSTWYGS
jgi:cytochrome c oxidase subunit 4